MCIRDSFKGVDKEEFIDNQREYGNIFKLLDIAMSFFFKHLSLSGKINSLYREEELKMCIRDSSERASKHQAYSP